MHAYTHDKPPHVMDGHSAYGGAKAHPQHPLTLYKKINLTDLFETDPCLPFCLSDVVADRSGGHWLSQLVWMISKHWLIVPGSLVLC